MEAGKLFQEVTIQQRNDSVNSIGESVASWATYAATYAEVVNLSGAELIQAQQVNSFVNSRVRVRVDSGIRADMRILFKSRHYNIIFVNEVDERDEEMILLCKRQESSANG